MQIYRELIVEAEDDAAKRVASSSLLYHGIFATQEHVCRHLRRANLLACSTMADEIAMRSKIAHVASMMSHAGFDDATWNYPLRIYVDAFYLACYDRRLGFHGSTHNLHFHYGIGAYRTKHVGRDVHHHIVLVVVWQIRHSPSATLHIHHNLHPLPSA